MKIEPIIRKVSDTYVEFSPGVERLCQVNVGTEQTVKIVKMFGPLIAHAVRIRLDCRTAEWVIESQRSAESLREDGSTDCVLTWVERARWGCQDGIADLNDLP